MFNQMETLNKHRPEKTQPSDTEKVNPSEFAAEFDSVPGPDWKSEPWSAKKAFEEAGLTEDPKDSTSETLGVIKASAGDAYAGGIIPDRLTGEYEGDASPLTQVQLERFYNLSKSSNIEAQRQLNSELSGVSKAQIVQWGEYLAARNADGANEWPSMSGNLQPLIPEVQHHPEKELSQEKMDMLYNLGSAGLEASGLQFKEQLDTLTPEQANKLIDYLLDREEDTPEAARIIHRLSREHQDVYFDKRNARKQEVQDSPKGETVDQPLTPSEVSTLKEPENSNRLEFEPKEPQSATKEQDSKDIGEPLSLAIEGELTQEQLEKMHNLGLARSKASIEQFGRLLNALTAEQHDQFMSYRARRILNEKYPTPQPEQRDSRSRSAGTTATRPEQATANPPKRRWWNSLFRRKK